MARILHKQSLLAQKTRHIPPQRARSGLSIVRIFEKIDGIITAPHCTMDTSSGIPYSLFNILCPSAFIHIACKYRSPNRSNQIAVPMAAIESTI